jgi:hypothetical protein
MGRFQPDHPHVSIGSQMRHHREYAWCLGHFTAEKHATVQHRYIDIGYAAHRQGKSKAVQRVSTSLRQMGAMGWRLKCKTVGCRCIPRVDILSFLADSNVATKLIRWRGTWSSRTDGRCRCAEMHGRGAGKSLSCGGRLLSRRPSWLSLLVFSLISLCSLVPTVPPGLSSS